MIVFDWPPFEDWAFPLSRVGRLVQRMEPTKDIAITFTLEGARRMSGLGVHGLPRRFSPNGDTFDLLDHTFRFHRWMWEHHRTWKPHRLEQPAYPCIAKFDRSHGGCGVRLIRTSAEDPTSGLELLMEAVRGRHEYIWHAAALRGEVLVERTFRVDLIDDLEIRRGPRPGIVVAPPVDLDVILRELDYTGFACANYKMVDGVPKIFEINPRMGGSLVHAPQHLAEMLAVVKERLA